jgi:hypothetical protein
LLAAPCRDVEVRTEEGRRDVVRMKTELGERGAAVQRLLMGFGAAIGALWKGSARGRSRPWHRRAGHQGMEVVRGCRCIARLGA